MLTARQLKAYTDTVDVYDKPSLGTSGWLTDMVVSSTASQTAVPCLWLSQPEDNEPGPLGRSENDILVTQDVFHFTAGAGLNDQDMLKLTTSGHPSNGSFFIVQGIGRERITRGNRKGNYLKVYAKRLDTPPVSS